MQSVHQPDLDKLSRYARLSYVGNDDDDDSGGEGDLSNDKDDDSGDSYDYYLLEDL